MCKIASNSCLSSPGVLSQRVQRLLDDESSSTIGKDDGLECLICYESFNVAENVPYGLWCGHSLCKNCVLSLHRSVVKINSSSIQLPLLISCPWCNFLSPRLVLGGNLKFPRKNYFLLWMVERINRDHKVKSRNVDSCGDFQPLEVFVKRQTIESNVQKTQSYYPTTSQYRQSYLLRFLFMFIELTSKFPLVVIFLLLLLFAIPASLANLAVYIVLTVVFALPSFLVLYFSYPSLEWLAREIMA